MKTISARIEEALLRALDHVAADQPGPPNRSLVVRQAIAEFLQRKERLAGEAQEQAVWLANIDRINAQAAAMVEEQGKL